MRLGSWIETLDALPKAARVELDNGKVPTRLCSWRGVYAELTLDSDVNGEPITVRELLKDARAAVGKTFTGYKGGDYAMNEHTPVWADEYGDCDYTGIVGVRVEGERVVVVTADLGDYR